MHSQDPNGYISLLENDGLSSPTRSKGKFHACAQLKMGLLSDAPQGFSSAVSSLNSIPQSVLAEMVSCLEKSSFLLLRMAYVGCRWLT